ncbi:TVP38/TMEM64 family protein [Thalassorhabdus alkalitolerans]|uniref:TVP38/TMEM64 family protein n=1 Tax=Thalassorhabdus alkalitolerans TaxID=2282697 RepID=A0ABW0YPS6_9BACI|nr:MULTISPECIES: VTT domain-containing protein [Bacillaceae]
MESNIESILYYIEVSGWLAPVLFIVFHVIRQFFFIPVAVVCIIGGMLFGTIYGTIYSVVGLLAVSIAFYGVVSFFPFIREKIRYWKEKWLGGKEEITIPEIMLLRMMPFIHFHLLNAYVMEMTGSFRGYVKLAFFASIPPALVYTSFGHVMREMPWYASLFMTAVLISLFFISRNKHLFYKVKEFLPNRSAS